jgi:light-regulated signal transduction histidine kinase (bacteriophytochrome)
MKTRTYEELSQRVRELEEVAQEQEGVIGDLERRVRELGEISQGLGDYALEISRELQESLDVVATYLQFVEARYKDRLDADGVSFIDSAVDGVARMRERINALLIRFRKRDEDGYTS